MGKNSHGRTVTIERNDDGSFTVSDDEGRSITYGEDVATNMYQDWDLKGVDLSSSGVQPDPDPVNQGPGGNEGGGNEGGGNEGGGNEGGGNEGGGNEGGGNEGGGNEGGGNE